MGKLSNNNTLDIPIIVSSSPPILTKTMRSMQCKMHNLVTITSRDVRREIIGVKNIALGNGKNPT